MCSEVSSVPKVSYLSFRIAAALPIYHDSLDAGLLYSEERQFQDGIAVPTGHHFLLWTKGYAVPPGRRVQQRMYGRGQWEVTL